MERMNKKQTKREAVEFVYTGQENLEAMKEAKNYNQYLVSLIKRHLPQNNKEKAKILDFGAGIGTYADMLTDAGYVVDCLELDQDQVRQLKAKNYRVYDNLNSIQIKYDMIYAFNVFEHIEEDVEVFVALASKLTDRGVAVIYVPAFPVLFSSMDKLVGHHRRYKLNRLKNMAAAAGLQTQYVGYGEPIGFLAALAYKIVGNKNGTITPSSVKLYDTVAFPLSKVLSPIFKHLLGKNALLVASKEL
jgi:2-polyprenyl-3-methyl-5-hydroxy-6-metoxy-1,4-benzoquinol methylase